MRHGVRWCWGPHPASTLLGTLRSWIPGLCGTLWLIGAQTNACYGEGGPRHAPTLADLTTLRSLDLTLSLSSDGNWLAMGGSDGGLTVVSTRNLSNLRKLGNGSSPLWSPDRTKLAFLSTRGGDLQLWVYERSSQTLTQVTHVDGGIDPDPTSRVVGLGHDAFRYDWSPHSDTLVFASRVPTSMEVPGTSPAPTGSSGSAAPLILTASTPAEWTLAGIFSHGFGTMESKDGSSITLDRMRCHPPFDQVRCTSSVLRTTVCDALRWMRTAISIRRGRRTAKAFYARPRDAPAPCGEWTA
jgi:hypothetical protein